MPISDFYGKKSRCHCTNDDPSTPMPCERCYCRGYTAECLSCKGAGQTVVPVAGGSGEMKSTCSICGGKGRFGVPKPADWDILHPAETADVETTAPVEAKPSKEPIEEVASVA